MMLLLLYRPVSTPVYRPPPLVLCLLSQPSRACMQGSPEAYNRLLAVVKAEEAADAAELASQVQQAFHLSGLPGCWCQPCSEYDPPSSAV